jgi:hemoglobin-like flavoprotein
VNLEQIALVESTLSAVDLDDLTADFYRRAFEADEALSAMFTSDPVVQRARFAAELAAIVDSIRALDTFEETTHALGARHRGYGVRSRHYVVMGTALLASLAAALGEGWTRDVEEAWTLAYNLTAESMMIGATQGPAQG